MTLELTLPYIGLGRADEAKKFVDGMNIPEAERGAAKGLEKLDIYSRLAEKTNKIVNYKQKIISWDYAIFLFYPLFHLSIIKAFGYILSIRSTEC